MKWKMTTLVSELQGSPFAKLVCANVQKESTFLSHFFSYEEISRALMELTCSYQLLSLYTTVQTENKVISLHIG